MLSDAAAVQQWDGGNTGTVHRAALVSATVAPVALIGGWTLAQSRQPDDYDALRDTISALAASAAPHRWIMTTALLVLGLCHVVTAVCLTDATVPGRVLLAGGGVATIVVACAAQPAAAHVPAATVAFVALAVWPAVAGVPTRRSALLASLVLLGLLGWLSVELTGGLLGLSERCLAAAQALWPLVVVLFVRFGRARAVLHDGASEAVTPPVGDAAAIGVVHGPVQGVRPQPGTRRNAGPGERP